MEYTIKATEDFYQQLKALSPASKNIAKNRIILLKKNPFRNKRIKRKGLVIYRIRFKDQNKEKRLIYAIEKLEIILVCILDRKNDYKDLEKYLERQADSSR